MAQREKVDVVIVGAGPAGAIYTDQMTREGKSVVILEFGPDWDNNDFISSEIWGRRIKHAPRFELAGKNNPGHGFNAGWGTGGSMSHYYANFPRLLQNDFKVKSLYGKGLDWPISYEDIAPYYDRVAHDLGVSGDAEKERRWRPVTDAYPMPPLKTFRHGEIWREAFEKHGIPLAPMPTGINSVEYKGRPACLNDGWCHVGCPIGVHGTPQWSYLATAREQKAEIRPFSYVTRVLTDASGARAAGVEYYDDKKEAGRQPSRHDGDAVHVLRALRQGPFGQRVRQCVLDYGQRPQAKCGNSRCAARSVRCAAERVHAARVTRAREAELLRRGNATAGKPCRVVEPER
ncbi:MAG: glucose-methanol-choline oxidoreductase [Hyphomicrobiales bacterium]|nr:glucose-methanol-choline oxidoreductase [Hyphomicrobiales bacterium]